MQCSVAGAEGFCSQVLCNRKGAKRKAHTEKELAEGEEKVRVSGRTEN